MHYHFSAVLCLLACVLFAADAPKGPPEIVITDTAGKEHKVKTYTITAGTTHLSWLVNEEELPIPKGKKRPAPVKVGPEAVVVREGSTFAALEGVVTLVPLTNIKSIEFDPVLKVMIVTAVTAGEEVKLAGTTAYKGINKFSLEADVDKGAAGVASAVYEGGVPAGTLKAVTFTHSKPAEVKGRPAIVQSVDKKSKRTDTVHNLMPLYKLPSGRLITDKTLLFKKTLRMDITGVRKIQSTKPEAFEPVWTVTQADASEEAYALLLQGSIADQNAELVGLIGQVPEGWRLFPARRIVSIEFDIDEAFKDKVLPQPRELKE